MQEDADPFPQLASFSDLHKNTHRVPLRAALFAAETYPYQKLDGAQLIRCVAGSRPPRALAMVMTFCNYWLGQNSKVEVKGGISLSYLFPGCSCPNSSQQIKGACFAISTKKSQEISVKYRDLEGKACAARGLACWKKNKVQLHVFPSLFKAWDASSFMHLLF